MQKYRGFWRSDRRILFSGFLSLILGIACSLIPVWSEELTVLNSVMACLFILLSSRLWKQRERYNWGSRFSSYLFFIVTTVYLLQPLLRLLKEDGSSLWKVLLILWAVVLLVCGIYQRRLTQAFTKCNRWMKMGLYLFTLIMIIMPLYVLLAEFGMLVFIGDRPPVYATGITLFVLSIFITILTPPLSKTRGDKMNQPTITQTK